jgi:hypothetical protein
MHGAVVSGSAQCHACSNTTVLYCRFLSPAGSRCRCRACMLYCTPAGRPGNGTRRRYVLLPAKSAGSIPERPVVRFSAPPPPRTTTCMHVRSSRVESTWTCRGPSPDGVPPHRSTTHPRHQYVRRRSRSRLITLMVVTAIMQHCMPTYGTHLLAISLLRMNVALWDVSGTSTHVLLLKRGFVLPRPPNGAPSRIERHKHSHIRAKILLPPTHITLL